MLKFDPASQTSEVTLLKDILSVDAIAKFQARQLGEIKNIGYSYRGLKEGRFKASGLQSQTIDKASESMRQEGRPRSSQTNFKKQQKFSSHF